MKFLVVGGNGLIGNSICQYITRTEEEPHYLLHTTRDKRSVAAGGITFLDLMKPEAFTIKDKFDLAFICAGVTGDHLYETDIKSWRVNVDGVLNIAMRLIKQYNTFVVYPSTQTVEWWNWSVHARQRAQVEAVLLSTWRAAIVRLGRITEKNKPECAKGLVDIGLTFQPGVYRWP